MTFDGEDTLRSYIASLSNWGRWGPDDTLGTLNFVGPAEVVRAASLVELKITVSCTLPLDQHGPQRGVLRGNPRNMMVATGTDHASGAQDIVPAGLALPTASVDRTTSSWSPTRPAPPGTLCRMSSRRAECGMIAPPPWCRPSGAAVNGIEGYAGRMAMRGVLLDVARAKGLDHLEPGYAITADDLDEVSDHERVELRRGDAILVRTGFLESRRGNWGDFAGGTTPGLSVDTAPWFHSHESAAVATDTWALEVRPSELGVFQPFHIIALVHMGLALGEIFDLERLGEVCAETERFEFLFVAPALPITGASGSPTGAIAIL